MDTSSAARTLAASRLLVLKAIAPELAEMAAIEAQLANELLKVHERAAGRAGPAATSAATPGATPEHVVAVARRAYEAEFNEPATKMLQDAVRELYKLGKAHAYGRATGQRPVDAVKKADRPATLSVGFDVQDEEAIAALMRHQQFWIGNHFDANLSTRIANAARMLIAEQGMGGVEAGRRTRGYVVAALAIPPEDAVPTRYTGNPRKYFQNLAANAATTGRVFGSVSAFRELDVRELEVVNAIDERTCPRCSRMDGKVFTVEVASRQAKRTLNAADPAAVRRTHPWLTEAKFIATVPPGKGTAASNESLAVRDNVCLPPYHFGCRCTVDVAEGTRIEPVEPSPGPSPGPTPEPPPPTVPSLSQKKPEPAPPPPAAAPPAPPAKFMGKLADEITLSKSTPDEIAKYYRDVAEEFRARARERVAPLLAGGGNPSRREIDKVWEGVFADVIAESGGPSDEKMWGELIVVPKSGTGSNVTKLMSKVYSKRAVELYQLANMADRGRTGNVIAAQRVRINTKVGRRASFSLASRIANLATGERPEIVLHEFAHWVEYYSPGMLINDVIRDFLARRTAGEKLVKLKTFNPAYKDDEVSRPDKFFSPYVGKEYGRRGVSEAFSMGVEQFNHGADMQAFAMKDPEHFGMTVSLLAGRVRP